MERKQLSQKLKMVGIMLIIGFLVYNIVIFAIFGFSNHRGAFWTSYVFMLVAFAVLTISGSMLKKRGLQPRDWLLNYPVLRHCTIYIVLELVASLAFMISDRFGLAWTIPFVVQIVLLAVHLMFIISCFLAKEIIEDLQVNVKTNTQFMKRIKVDVEMIAEKAEDNDVKRAFSDLAEKITYSDIVSSEGLQTIEGQISNLVKDADGCVVQNDNEEALKICHNVELLLIERNKMCKALK